LHGLELELHLVAGSGDGSVQYWVFFYHPEQLVKLVCSSQVRLLKADQQAVTCVKFKFSSENDGHRVAAIKGCNLVVINLPQLTVLKVKAANKFLTCLAWSVDGNRIVTTSIDSPELKLWQADLTPIASTSIIHQILGCYGVVFSPLGFFLAVVSK
jgi:WD40 repeat protein